MSIVSDLALHLDQRITTAIEDYLELCEMANCHHDEVKGHAIKILGEHLTALAVAVEATEPEFVSMCRWHFHNARAAADG